MGDRDKEKFNDSHFGPCTSGSPTSTIIPMQVTMATTDDHYHIIDEFHRWLPTTHTMFPWQPMETNNYTITILLWTPHPLCMDEAVERVLDLLPDELLLLTLSFRLLKLSSLWFSSWGSLPRFATYSRYLMMWPNPRQHIYVVDNTMM